MNDEKINTLKNKFKKDFNISKKLFEISDKLNRNPLRNLKRKVWYSRRILKEIKHIKGKNISSFLLKRNKTLNEINDILYKIKTRNEKQKKRKN